jgi:hypothetical protein
MKKNRINEATGSGNSGHYKTPIVLAPQIWEKKQLGPFTDEVYHYTNAELAYEEADGDYNETPQQRNSIETKTKKLSKMLMKQKQSYQGQNDEEGSAINPTLSGEPLKEGISIWGGTKRNTNKILIKKPQNESLRGLITKIIKEQIKKND